MTDFIEILESFNRKERFFLIAQALGLHADCGKPAFSLSDSFREQLNTKFDLKIPQGSENVFVAMDYHLDWLQAALSLTYQSPDEDSVFPNEGKVIEGTQQDIDLLIAFRAGKKFHLILVEAKAYSGWTNKQMCSKAARLRKIFGEDGKKWPNVQPYFYAIGPQESDGLKTGSLPEWMLNADRKLKWLHLKLPQKRRIVVRRDRDKDGKAYRKFRVEIKTR